MSEMYLENIHEYPEPIRHSYLKIQDESDSYCRMRRLLDCFECFLKFLTISVPQDISQKDRGQDVIVRILSGAFIKPTLGIWQSYLNNIIENVGEDQSLFMKELPRYYGVKGKKGLRITNEKTQLFQYKEALDTRYVKSVFNAFITIRNEYAHASIPDSEDRSLHFDILLPIFHEILRKASFLTTYQVVMSEAHHLHLCLRNQEGDECCFYPMFISHNERIFMYRDAKLYRKRKITYQDYTSATSLLDEEVYGTFQQLYPLEKLRGSILYLNKAQHYGEIFGRDEDLRIVQGRLESGQPRILITGFPGIGKTAFSHYLCDHGQQSYFCVRVSFNANDRQTLSLSDLYTTIVYGLYQYGLVTKDSPPDFSVSAVRKILYEMLSEAAVASGPTGKQILLIIDGLDEVVFNNATDCLEVLPVTLPKNCHMVLLSRPIPFVTT